MSNHAKMGISPRGKTAWSRGRAPIAWSSTGTGIKIGVLRPRAASPFGREASNHRQGGVAERSNAAVLKS